MWTIQGESLEVLVEVLKQHEYRVVGPRMRDGAIVLEDLSSASDLPHGWVDEQEAGSYRLKPAANGNLFDYVVGPQSWKKFLQEPVLKLWTARRDKKGLHLQPIQRNPPKLAFLGIRSCELAAIEVQDTILLRGDFIDEAYRLNRNELFTIAVNCSQPAATCFCASMGTGPVATRGFDLALTEISQPGSHRFLVEVGTSCGEEILSHIPRMESSEVDRKAAAQIKEKAAKGFTRHLSNEGMRDILMRHFDNPLWEQISRRCLACANCTLVCPTCFCTTIEDSTDLRGENAQRQRRVDSCFTRDFSYIHGGSVRTSLQSRYRQWMTHKLAGWVDQFGTPGCVGCGRCITWCPVGIDITQEAAAIRASDTVLERV
jgi:sulfhydrogenase subunit beta (sulfur reductase)